MRAMVPLVLAGCLSGPTEGYSGAVADDGAVNSQTESSSEQVDDDVTDDSGGVEQEESEEETAVSVRFEGDMEVTYTYSGSLGEFSDECGGSAFIVVDGDELEGEGICENDVLTFGFIIEGSVDGNDMEGLLVSDNAAGRAETPFTGLIDGTDSSITFDHTHAADGESLRLDGSMSLVKEE